MNEDHHQSAPVQIRRLSLYRQLSDVLKSKRKSCSYISPPTTSAGLSFIWNSTVTDNKNFIIEEESANLLVKQKSISYDDVVFLATTEDDENKRNGLDYFPYRISLSLFLFVFN